MSFDEMMRRIKAKERRQKSQLLNMGDTASGRRMASGPLRETNSETGAEYKGTFSVREYRGTAGRHRGRKAR